ncbi:glycoprotein [Tsukamurella soli]|uniref:glycoprotein n=1 Tax=Tsukamurella soli TaxID=644556 RepID=UPI00360F8528
MIRAARLSCVLFVLAALLPWAAPDAHAGMPIAQFVRISLDQMTPDVVTNASPDNVIVLGTLTNFGDRDVSDLEVRLQRGPALTSSDDIRSTLVADNNTYDTIGRFHKVVSVLHPGQQASFALSMPVRSTTTTSGPTLGIHRPGVYPLLVNVNGKPAYGGVARLDDSRTLLPVLSLPQSQATASGTGRSGSAAQPDGGAQPDGAAQSGTIEKAVTTSPARLTMLWPLADNPKLAGGVPGGGDPPVRLVDDALAASLAPGGRLYGLLDAYDSATRGNDPAAQALRTATCVAIDPDLLVTVQAMTGGYLVSRDPGDAHSPATPGRGSAAATAWLARLRAVAARSCTVALPFGQVDLDALDATGNAALLRAALTAPADVIDSVLGVASQRGIAVPASGMLLAPGAAALRSTGVPAAVIAATAVSAPNKASPRGASGSGTDTQGTGSDAQGDGIVGLGRGLAAATFDPNITAALGAMGEYPAGSEDHVRPGDTGTDRVATRFPLGEESAMSRRLAAVGALMQPALDPTQRIAPPGGWAATVDPDPIGTVIDGRSELVAPPQVWAASPDDARAVLTAASTLLTAGLAVPRPFAEVAGAAQSEAATPTRPVRAPRRPPGTAPPTMPAWIVASAAGYAADLDQFGRSLVAEPKGGLTPGRYISPLREDALRALRFAPHRAAVDGDARIRLAAARGSLTAQLGSVTIVAPGGSYTLASQKAPILLVARNDLPLPITTTIRWSAPDGVSINSSEVEELPPRGTRQIELPTKVNFSRMIAVDLSLQTTAGQDLGQPIRVTVHSNAYGRALFIITIGAGALLVLLSGRRLWRRFRGRPDPADVDRPPADEHDRLMANSYAAHTSPRRAPADRPTEEP